MNWRWLGLIGFIVAVVAIGFFFYDRDQQNPGNGDDLDTVTLQVSWTVSPEHAFLLLGSEEIFPAYGIDLELAPSRGSNETLASVTAGRYPFVIASAESMVLARAEGAAVRSVLQLYRESPAVVFSIDGQGIDEPRDLIDRRVGVIRTSTVTTQFNLMLQQAGIQASDDGRQGTVHTVTATQGGIAQLESGQIDALTQYTNYAPAQFQSGGRAVSQLFFRDHGIDIYSAGVIVSDQLVQDDAELVQRFVCAFSESIALAQQNPDRAIAAYQAWSQRETGSFDQPYAERSIASTNQLLAARLDGHRPGYHDEAGWVRTLDTIRATTDGERVSAVEVGDLFAPAFMAVVDSGDCQALRRR